MRSIRENVERAGSTGSLTSAQAGKLRGLAGWSGSLLHGKCGRLHLQFLKPRQYQEIKSDIVNEDDMEELRRWQT